MMRGESLSGNENSVQYARVITLARLTYRLVKRRGAVCAAERVNVCHARVRLLPSTESVKKQ